MTDIVAFLNARLDEDEAAARAVPEPDRRWVWRDSTAADVWAPDSRNFIIDFLCVREAGPHVELHDPARVLREVEAKRRIVADYETALMSLEVSNGTILGGAAKLSWRARKQAVEALATVWADHPDYDEDWRP